MSKSFNISLKEPCKEDFSNFVPTEKGGYCNNCHKEVVDFTQMSQKQLFAYFTEENRKTCGRFRAEQLGFLNEGQGRICKLSTLLAASVGILAAIISLPTKAAPKLNVASIIAASTKSDAKSPVLSDSLRQVSGRIVHTDELLPLAGVAILLKGTQTGTATDADGRFTLVLPARIYLRPP
ncbi:hypothetical protein GCM10028895_09710 [Pontibacter rugosus]